jgi:hypothetical protein
MKELEHLTEMVVRDDVSSGEVVAALIDVQERVGISEVVSKIATRLAETLQTVVTKSG